VDVLQNMKILI